MNDKIKTDMLILLGQLEAIRFPILNTSDGINQPYYDLIDHIHSQYVNILECLGVVDKVEDI